MTNIFELFSSFFLTSFTSSSIIILCTITGIADFLAASYLPWAAVLVWMAAIFYFSHQPASESGRLSRAVTIFLIGLIRKAVPEAAIEEKKTHHIVRKNAHFFMFFILGILVFSALLNSGTDENLSFWYALTFCALYAVSDETHQLFIQGRSGNAKDVLIDTLGALTGIGLVWLIF